MPFFHQLESYQTIIIPIQLWTFLNYDSGSKYIKITHCKIITVWYNWISWISFKTRGSKPIAIINDCAIKMQINIR